MTAIPIGARISEPEPIPAAGGMAAIPPAAGIGSGSEIRAPMGVAGIGGLIVATVLSLLVVPAFYLVTDRIRERVKGRRGEEAPDATPSEPSPSAP